ncbi:transcriptional regulator [Enterococcus florum]|uniref:Transcriptional regulator n=1 Tax=Enterococcus florum TaxID=2480627 RepID=A0A4P5PI42_9ENTE|nr:winged helix-turn-helix domain-containing protein [Enterococcus florum]GCF95322.1 transcriptional regulator [Enterococcus florum]
MARTEGRVNGIDESMKRILIFTQNILNEKEIQQNIQRLNYEVFVSESLSDFSTAKEILDYFSVIIMSETLSNATTEQLVPKLIEDHHILIKKEGKLEERVVIGHRTIRTIDAKISLEELREVLISFFPVKTVVAEEPKARREFPSLNRLDMKVLAGLEMQNGHAVSRSDLCGLVWGSDYKISSKLSQLSIIVKRINQKFAAENIQDVYIDTIWGVGYKLVGNVDGIVAPTAPGTFENLAFEEFE